jgi:hypothetical protein
MVGEVEADGAGAESSDSTSCALVLIPGGFATYRPRLATQASTVCVE